MAVFAVPCTVYPRLGRAWTTQSERRERKTTVAVLERKGGLKTGFAEVSTLAAA